MAQWLITFNADPPSYKATCGDQAYALTITGDDGMAYWRAAQMMLANIKRRFEDEAPVFAAHADVPEGVAFAEMLNA